MSEVKLKDVIPFYYGAEVVCIDNLGLRYELKIDAEFIGDMENNCYPEIQIVLRKLESMTEEENRQMMNDCQYRTSVPFAVFEARKTLWFTSHGFDVFQLIESNQAIEKK